MLHEDFAQRVGGGRAEQGAAGRADGPADAWQAFGQGLKLDQGVMESIRARARELDAEGRPDSAAGLLARAASAAPGSR